MCNPDNSGGELNQLIQKFNFQKTETQTGRSPPQCSKLWFLTPETCNDFLNFTPLQREVFDRRLKLQTQENWILKIMALKNWDFWKKNHGTPKADQKKQLEEVLVEFQDVFANHRFDVGYNTDLKIKPTTGHPHPLSVQGPPAPMHLCDEILIELLLLQ